jgi:hypothetical protein
VTQGQTLTLSIGERIPDRRLSVQAYSGVIRLFGKQVIVDVSRDAVRAAADSPCPVIAELELYFSCLVRKQVRFLESDGHVLDGDERVRIVPGLYATFRAVTTRHCAIAEVGNQPPVETMAVRHPERFVPDWIRVDYRGHQWRGAYGFATRSKGALSPVQTGGTHE